MVIKMESNYRVFFNELIWSRGKTYYEAGRVKSIKGTSKGYTATVKGTSLYTVTFSTAPVTMNCTCPHAKEGHKCKHMAAAFIALEAHQAKAKKGDTQTNPYIGCSWYPYIKKYYNAKTGASKDDYEVMRQLRGFLNMVCDCEPDKRKDYFQEIILMVYFLENESKYYYGGSIVSACLKTLIRFRALADTGLQRKYDQLVLLMLNKLTDKDLVKTLMEDYFTYPDQMAVMLDALKQDTAHSNTTTARSILNLIKDENMVPTEPMVEQLKHYVSNKQVREWMMDYYETTQQYDKNIIMLENYRYNLAAINEDISEEMLSLFVSYAKCHKTTKRDALFEELKKNRKIKKPDLFLALKNSMSQEEWNHSGKQQVLEWTKGKNRENCLHLYRSIEAADLLFMELLKSYSLQNLNDHFFILEAYDPGLLYEMYKMFLIHQFNNESLYYPESICSNFLYYYRETPKSILALKEIIVELRDGYQENKSIIDALDRMEDRLYE